MTATGARERILGRLQKNAPNAALPCPGVPATAPIDASGRVGALTAALEAAHAEVLRVSRSGLDAAVLDYCRRNAIRSLMIPTGPLPIRLDAAPASLRVERFDRPLESIKPALFSQVDAGLTVADCAVAGNGTLVMASSPTLPRTLSLIPPTHLCLLDERRIHADMATALAQEGWAKAMPTNLIFVSGPSKTADIQQTLAYGAHGPKTLTVFIYGEDER